MADLEVDLDVTALVAWLRFPQCAIHGSDAADAIIAALERAERVEKAAREMYEAAAPLVGAFLLDIEQLPAELHPLRKAVGQYLAALAAAPAEDARA